MAHSLTHDQQAIARTQIAAVIHRYASLGRENADWAALGKLLAPGAIYRLADGTELPADKMSEVVRGKEAPYIRHHVTTIDVQFVSDTEARGETFFFATTDSHFNDHWGHWTDIFRKQPEGSWLIQDRTIVIEGMFPGGWCDKIYGSEALKTAEQGS